MRRSSQPTAVIVTRKSPSPEARPSTSPPLKSAPGILRNPIHGNNNRSDSEMSASSPPGLSIARSSASPLQQQQKSEDDCYRGSNAEGALLTETRQLLNKLNDENVDLRRELQHLQELLEDAQADAERLATARDDCEAEHARALQIVQSQLREKVGSNTELMSQIDRLRCDADAARDREVHLTHDNNMLRQQVQQARDEVEHLRSELAALRQGNTALEAAREETSARLRHSQAQGQSAEQQRDALDRELRAAHCTISNLQQENVALREEAHRLHSIMLETSRGVEDRMCDLYAMVRHITAEVQQQGCEVECVSQSNADARDALNALVLVSGRIDTKTQQHATGMQSALRDGETRRQQLEGDVHALTAARDQLQEHVGAYSHELDVARRNVAALKEDLATQTHKRKSAAAQCAAERATVEQLRAEVDTLQVELATARAEAAAVEDEARSEHAAAEARWRDEAQILREELAQRREAEQRARDQHKSEIHALERKLGSLQRQLTVCGEVSRTVSEQKSKLERQLHAAMHHNPQMVTTANRSSCNVEDGGRTPHCNDTCDDVDTTLFL